MCPLSRQAIGKRVFALKGITPATNYLSLPRPSLPGLGLTSPLLYLELCLVPEKFFTIRPATRRASSGLRMYLTRSSAQLKPPSVATHFSCPLGGSPRSATMLQMPCGARDDERHASADSHRAYWAYSPAQP